MNDLSLRNAILDELEFLPEIDAANIGVAVDNGVVTLSGHVSSYAQKISAERAVKSLKGVRAVAEVEQNFTRITDCSFGRIPCGWRRREDGQGRDLAGVVDLSLNRDPERDLAERRVVGEPASEQGAGLAILTGNGMQ